MANLPDLEKVQTPAQLTANLKSEFETMGKSDLPHFEEEPREKAGKNWSFQIHDFHMAGGRIRAAGDESPLVPALLGQMERDGRLEPEYPFFLPDASAEDAAPEPVSSLLERVLHRCEEDGVETRILEENLPLIVRFLNRYEGGTKLTPDILADIPEVFDLSSAGKEALERELEALTSHLDLTGCLLTFEESSLLELFAWTSAHVYMPHRRCFQEEVRQLKQALESLLLLERQKSPESRTPEALASVIGVQGEALLDPSALSKSIPSPEGPLGLSAERKSRIEAALKVLSEYLVEVKEAPPFYLIHGDTKLDLTTVPASARIEHSDSFIVALGVFNGMMAKMVEVFKAVRTARLELEGNYDADRHDKLLSHFEWQSCAVEEIRAVTPVVILATAEEVYESGLPGLSKVLGSGAPLKVLISTPSLAAASTPEERASEQGKPDLGYLAIAHREALVGQSSLIQPSQVVHILGKVVMSLRPAIAVIAVPDDSAGQEWVWLQSFAAHAGRSIPSFVYDPEAGLSWAERFRLEPNPEPEKRWFTVEWTGLGPKGSSETVEEALTLAHAACLYPSYRTHFLEIPREAWSEELVAVETYLEEYVAEPPRKVPFVWVVDEQENLRRAIVTRELVNLCRDRQRLWSTLQELAGINNEYVLQAIQQTRQEAENAAEAKILEAQERARTEGATEAIERLVAIFTDPSALNPTEATASRPLPPVVESVSEEVEEQLASRSAATAPSEEEEEVFSAEPYIDSFLCTSCNDCINLNPLLFKYDGNKQAIIGDVSAGTFLQLVKAAEACPAKCIHPGEPAAGDETATAEVIARARALQ